MAVSIRYWVSTDSPVGFPDLQGIDDFRNELAKEYAALVRGRPAGAGGPVHMLAQIISGIPWTHVVQLIVDGAAYDLIKEGSRSFILRPFISAFRKLKERNQDRLVDLAELQIDFEDFQLIVHEIARDTIIDHLGVILQSLAEHYPRLLRPNGEPPAEIHVPVFEDPDPDPDPERSCRFRETARVDETIRGKAPGDYLAFWGLVFDHTWPSKVYDVQNAKVLDEKFNTISEHWEQLRRRLEAELRSSPDASS